MKKTLLILSALAALALAGCTKVENFSSRENSGKEIGFSTYTGRALTKSGTALNQSFNVESFLSVIPAGASTRTIFFPSTKYNYTGSKYVGEITRLWPAFGDNLDFYAVSPVQYKNTLAADVDLKPAADSTFSVAKTDGTTDIVAARKVNVLNGTDPVELVFGHKLTKVAFKAIGADQNKKYVIKDIILNANSSAPYHFGATESWGASTDGFGYDYVSSDVEIEENTSSAVSVGSAKYLIPSQAATVSAVVKYLIIEGTTIVDDNTAGVSVNLPTTGIWGINKSVVYTLTLNYSSSVKVIHFSAEVDDWETENSFDFAGVRYVEDGVDYGAGVLIDSLIWAPVNCGYRPNDYPYGRLYQWGRKDGQGYSGPADANPYYPSDKTTSIGVDGYVSDLADIVPAEFYFGYGHGNWYHGTNPPADSLWKEDGSTPYNPCPDGWRVPTNAEWISLAANQSDWLIGETEVNGQRGLYFSGSKTYSESVPRVFFPAAGYRTWQYGNSKWRGHDGLYWTSTSYINCAYYVQFNVGGVRLDDLDYMSIGLSVRCVHPVSN